MSHSTLHRLAGLSHDRDITRCPPFTTTGIERQAAAVIAPLALRYRGWPTRSITHSSAGHSTQTGWGSGGGLVRRGAG
jgi:hypothetical protein